MAHDLSSFFPPRRNRMHEVCGAGAFGCAGALAATLAGDIFWCVEKWCSGQLNPLGLADFVDPSRVLIATSKDQMETLAITEEALRSGAVSLVVSELTAALTLTAGRRLQLAAEDGKTTGLCIIPEGMGSNAADSRWRCAPVFDAADPMDSTRVQWEIIKNKTGTLDSWDVRWHKSTRRLHVVSQPGQRPGSQGAPD